MQARFRHLAIAVLLAATAAAPARAADDTLYRALGETSGLKALTTDFVTRLKADPRIGHHFKEVRRDFLAQQLADQFCRVAGGTCDYDGENMAKAHALLGITRVEFNRLVEVLQDTMDARGIDFQTQNALLARLAPMHRDIVTR